MKAEELIDRYLEQTTSWRWSPSRARYVIKHDDPKAVANAVKGLPVKKDKLQDAPFRDTDNNIDQDNSWRSSSEAPYQ